MKTVINKFSLFLMVGVICMLNSCNYTDGFKYTLYSSKDPELNITIDYISNWLSREHKGPNNSYVSVLFFDDKQGEKLKAKMVVTVSEEIKPISLKEKADDLVAKRLKFKEARLLSKSQSVLHNIETMDILVSYKAMDKLYGTDAKFIPAKERMFIFNKGNKFYFLRYESSAEDFEKYNPAFTHMLKSIKFKASK